MPKDMFRDIVDPTVKAAMLVAARDAAEAGLVSASAAALTEGVLRTMLVTKLKSAAATLLAAGAIASGVGLYAYQGPESPPASTFSRTSSRSPPFCFSAPWHFRQCSSNTGRTSF